LQDGFLIVSYRSHGLKKLTTKLNFVASFAADLFNAGD
jgi:hypothetical protein